MTKNIQEIQLNKKYKAMNESARSFYIIVTKVTNKFIYYDWFSNGIKKGHSFGLTKAFWVNYE